LIQKAFSNRKSLHQVVNLASRRRRDGRLFETSFRQRVGKQPNYVSNALSPIFIVFKQANFRYYCSVKITIFYIKLIIEHHIINYFVIQFGKGNLMFDDPYRRLLFETNESSNQTGPETSDLLDNWEEHPLMSVDIRTGKRVLLAGVTTPDILPILKFRIGIAGQLLLLDPNPEALSGAGDNDLNWSVPLMASAANIPLKNAYVDTVLCWSSFLDISDKKQAVNEFFRVLVPGGKVMIVQVGPGPPIGRARPCVFGMKNIFIEAGFIDLKWMDNDELYVFTAEKVTRYFLGKLAKA
jgi:ubiquinone/menaquinone biosynthesis C-methylase UbiE